MSKENKVDTGGGAYVIGGVTVSGGGDFVGRDQVKTSGLTVDEIAELFKALYAAIERRPDTPSEDKADLETELQGLQAEVARGEEADEHTLARHLRYIGRIAPDILDVVTATLTSPIVGLAAVVKKVAQKARGAVAGGV